MNFIWCQSIERRKLAGSDPAPRRCSRSRWKMSKSTSRFVLSFTASVPLISRPVTHLDRYAREIVCDCGETLPGDRSFIWETTAARPACVFLLINHRRTVRLFGPGALVIVAPLMGLGKQEFSCSPGVKRIQRPVAEEPIYFQFVSAEAINDSPTWILRRIIAAPVPELSRGRGFSRCSGIDWIVILELRISMIDTASRRC